MATVSELDGRLGAMESRLSVSESQLTEANTKAGRNDTRIEGVLDRLARLEERVSHLPSKDFVVKVAVSTLVAFGVLLGIQVAVWKSMTPPALDSKAKATSSGFY